MAIIELARKELKLSRMPFSTFTLFYALGKLAEIPQKSELISIINEAKGIISLLQQRELIENRDDSLVLKYMKLSTKKIAQALDDKSLNTLSLYLIHRLLSHETQSGHYEFISAFGNDTMLEQIRLIRKREKGLFLKVNLQNNIITFTVITPNINSATKARIKDTESLFQDLGFRILELECIPAKRINFFPFFFVGTNIIKSERTE